MADSYKDFVVGDDGFVIYWPIGQYRGGYTSDILRVLADELDKRNAVWNLQLNDYFEKEEKLDRLSDSLGDGVTGG